MISKIGIILIHEGEARKDVARESVKTLRDWITAGKKGDSLTRIALFHYALFFIAIFSTMQEMNSPFVGFSSLRKTL